VNVSTPPAEGPWCEFKGCGLPASRYAELGASVIACCQSHRLPTAPHSCGYVGDPWWLHLASIQRFEMRHR
jgi:hypothetical protein